jgi:hypothetical protein
MYGCHAGMLHKSAALYAVWANSHLLKVAATVLVYMAAPPLHLAKLVLQIREAKHMV